MDVGDGHGAASGRGVDSDHSAGSVMKGVRDSSERRALTAGLLLTVTLVALESLAVATVMPQVRADLGGYDLYGWVFSGFFLASLVGIVVGGPAADRRGLVVPYGGGLGVFAVGLVVAGAAGSMEVLVVGRVLQGLGAGAVPAASYAAIARAFTSEERPRIFAMMSTAWVVPGLLGPAVAAWVEHALSWRWVFFGLLPFVAVAAAMCVRPLSRVPRAVGSSQTSSGLADGPPVSSSTVDASTGGTSTAARVARVAVLVSGVGALFVVATGVPMAAAVVLATMGPVAAGWAFVGLVPAGTVRFAAGVPATVAVKGLLTWCFFQADAYVSLLVVDGRGSSTFMAGAALSASSVLWAVGSWVQARRIGDRGPRALVGTGFVVVIVSLVMATGVALGAPVWVIVVAWGVSGFGVGLAYAPLSVVVLAAAPPGEEGAASAALQLCDVLGVAVGTGLGGAAVAIGDVRDWSVSSAVAIAFAMATAVAFVGLAGSRRIPASVPATTVA